MNSDIGVQHIEDFWGLELSVQKKSFDWEDEDADTPSDIDIEKTLELRQACLGASAKSGERNVVQITTENDEGQSITHTILSMRVGGTEQSPLFLTLQPPVKFELVSGSGPVHIVGSVNEAMTPFNLSSSDEDSDEDEEIASPEVKALIASSKKRPATSPAKNSAKMAKLDTMGDAEEDDALEKIKAVKKLKKDDEEEDMEDDDDDSEEESDEDEDEDEEDDDSEEDDSEDEEEEETAPPPKKSQQQTNGKLKGKSGKQGGKQKSVGFKTPQPAKLQNKQAQKGSQSAPTTPKQKVDKKKAAIKGGDAPSVDELKQKLLKLGANVPKKLEKFNNFVDNSFKVKDDNVKKQLWEFIQKSRSPK